VPCAVRQNFIRANLTATISWATIWSVYPVVDVFEGGGDALSGDGFWGPGLMYAWQPWSGHYAVPPTVWAQAHTCQFAQPVRPEPLSSRRGGSAVVCTTFYRLHAGGEEARAARCV
jgi:hypothetical protein